MLDDRRLRPRQYYDLVEPVVVINAMAVAIPLGESDAELGSTRNGE
jgi:hypothetical protein